MNLNSNQEDDAIDQVKAVDKAENKCQIYKKIP